MPATRTVPPPKKKGRGLSHGQFSSCKQLFLGLLLGFLLSGLVLAAEFLAEFFNTAHRVYELLFTRIKRMRGTRYIDVVYRVLVTIFPLDGLGRPDRRTCQDGKVGRLIFENDLAVFGMNVGFHNLNFVDCCTGSQS